MNPLTSLRTAVAAGFILSIAIALAVAPTAFFELGLARWLHVSAGIVWVGLLFYFLFVQMPALAEAAADKDGPGGAGIVRYAAPLALKWFRIASVLTWLTGVWYLGRSGNLAGALVLGAGRGSLDRYQFTIGLGAWLGTIMLFNVWALIWPNQRKIMGIVPPSEQEKARARSVARAASHANLALSIPMLLCMTSATHGLPL
jgi:uncharacterized membrane protein